MYLSSTPASFIISSAVSTIICLTVLNSFIAPTRGIIISGSTFNPSLFTAIAAFIIALVCITAISGYVTASLQPLCPNIGLNSANSSHLFLITIGSIPISLANSAIVSSSCGKNSCSGGSKSLILTGRSPITL